MKSASRAVPDKRTDIVVPFRRIQDRREELAFLPAALEIVETPPSPIGRLIAITIAVLFCAALVWSWWGTVDIVASAMGKIVTSGRTKVIQPFESGCRMGRRSRPVTCSLNLIRPSTPRNATISRTIWLPNNSMSRGSARRFRRAMSRWSTS
jgi:hypothetical protein